MVKPKSTSNIEALEDKNKIVWFADLLDTKFRIPGTEIRFGFDWIIGLIPGLGDSIALLLSGGLVVAMIKNGASGRALALMILNIFLDATFGSIPIIGDIFDLFFKANSRNLRLYEKHFRDGRYQGSASPIIIGFLFLIILIVVLIIYIIWLIIGRIGSFLW